GGGGGPGGGGFLGSTPRCPGVQRRVLLRVHVERLAGDGPRGRRRKRRAGRGGRGPLAVEALEHGGPEGGVVRGRPGPSGVLAGGAKARGAHGARPGATG